MKTDELREAYLAFFETKGCTRRPSDVLVPTWDPSVLFTPAGMNQFKDHFLGRVKLDFTRATTCQKCLRTGDIENVGRTAYHHTFFEMLGNFSFGDYFKRDAIHWAWEFLTEKKWLGIDPARLSASVYLDDDEAYGIWHDEIGLPGDKIARLDEDENFWPASAPSQGPDGVCGPCSEIFFHEEGGGEVEIWNLVFTQFNRVGDPPDNLRPLPSKNIDTGMGLERTAAVLQGVDTNYHIDILRPIVEAAGEVCGAKYDPDSDTGRRLRRIADHVRACTAAVHENVYPGPNKEKYVIRRLLRRAVLDGHQLGVRDPFLAKLVPAVIESLKGPYPEYQETVGRVQQVIENEESDFFGKIDAGLERIGRIFAGLKSEGRNLVPGQDAADMYTTHGFPPELFASMCAEHNLTFDWDGFQKAMDEHGVISGAGTQHKLFGDEGPMEALVKAGNASEFLGYESTEATGKVLGIIAQNTLCETLDEVGHKDPVVVILDHTPFYGESGGQVGDTGELVADGVRFEVTDTQRDRGLVLHAGHLRAGELHVGDQLTARVAAARRGGIRRAHSATHLLHFALQKHLGGHAQQQGSKVDDDWLRFDFTHPQAVAREELAKIEAEVNARVITCDAVSWENLPLPEARQRGAMMLFGEKYPDIVRMVTMGDFSRELCGGTHLDNTGEAGLFRIVGEESVSAGTRRITALTGEKALEHVHRHERLLGEAAGALRVPADQLPDRIAALLKENRQLKKRLETAATSGITPDGLLSEADEVQGVKIVLANVPGANPNSLRQLFDKLRQKVPAVIALLAAAQGDDKVTLICGMSRELTERGLKAGDLIKVPAGILGGGGGGRPDLAQAGGRHPQKIEEALAAGRDEIRAAIEAKVSV